MMLLPCRKARPCGLFQAEQENQADDRAQSNHSRGDAEADIEAADFAGGRH